MPDDPLFPEEHKEEIKPDPVMETLNQLKGSLDTITGRLDEFETRLEGSQEEEEEEETEEESFRPKTWDEIPQKAEEIAEEVVERRLQETKEEQEAAQEAEKQQAKEIDTYIDGQVAALEKDNIIPKVENPDNEDDPGRSARRELFGFAAHIGTMDLTKAAETLSILHKTGYTYDPRANNMKGEYLRSGTTPSGINSPVGSSSRSSGNFSGKPSYNEISGLSMDALIRKAMPDYQ